MSRLRLQASPCSSGQRAWYTVNLDGVPLGCQDDLRSDPALVIIVENEVATIPHRFRERIDGAMLFLETDKHRARSVAAKALKEYEAREAERNKGVHFDRKEKQKLRELADYCMRGYMGEHAHTVKMILAKVPR